jgi:hypothetical protein
VLGYTLLWQTRIIIDISWAGAGGTHV